MHELKVGDPLLDVVIIIIGAIVGWVICEAAVGDKR